ncbi:MAG: hypothetical protein JXO48_12360 [Deltaproteobacteria bacterium]|nr:hypothetical protein [Deltaproteobacteria bacterium]
MTTEDPKEAQDAVVQAMLGMVLDQARRMYSDTIVDYGINPVHHGILEGPDGYARMTGT